MTQRYRLERAWLGPELGTRSDVLVEIAQGRFTRVEPGAGDGLARDAVRLAGLALPGLANTHSHAFHRALRGRTQQGSGTFWTWREQMYAAAARLDPDTYFALARATFREMVAAGLTTVGEFHYLHHRPDGTPYAEPDAMGRALIAAAREAGIRIALLDTLYLSSGFGAPPSGVQLRYVDSSVGAWAERLGTAGRGADPHDGVRIGAAVHSVRAVPAADLDAVAAVVGERPFHVHLSEQVAENTACLAAYGVTPTRLLADHGLLRPTTTAVHATHLTDDDVALLGAAGGFAAFCPTTERDLGDGIGPGRALAAAGVRLTLGSDSHAVIDPFEEMRALELDERLATQRRGHWPAADLLTAAASDGHRSLGFPDAGAIETGMRADLVLLDTASPRTAGTGRDEHTAAYAATAADVLLTLVDGRVVFERSDEAAIGAELAAALERIAR